MTDENTGTSAVTEETDDLASNLFSEKPKEEDKSQEPKQEEKVEEKPKEGEEKIEKMVSLSALHEERERRKELQRKLEAQEERSTKIEERQTKILEAIISNKQPPEQEFIDPLKKLEDEVTGLRQTITQKDKIAEDADKSLREEQALVDRYKGSADAYTKEKPDFMEARTHLINSRIEELQLMGTAPEMIAQEIKALEKQIVKDAYGREVNPAELIYKLAEKRGYKPGAPKQQDKTVEEIDKGLKASKSLSSSGGSQSSSDDLEKMSATELGELSPDEFNSLWKKFEKKSSRA